MRLDPDACYRAIVARDRRFDGLFFVAVETTGVYCRPICPARTPRRDRCRFYGSAALAEQAGFRACFRCRPEIAPGAASTEAVSRLVAAAVARIDEGAPSVEDLAGELGVTSRHLRRAMAAELGVTPVELAQSRRLGLAKQLLHDTRLSLTGVALASGFGSVRRFNGLFRARFGRPPSAVRRQHGTPLDPGALVLRLGVREPFGWDALVRFLGARAIGGVEVVGEGRVRRSVRIGDRTGVVTVAYEPARASVLARVSPGLAGASLALARRLRSLLDLDHQPVPVVEHLGRDPLLGPLVRERPGLRVPGAIDPFELAVRAVLGQRISVAAATTLAGRLAARFGERLAEPEEGVDRVFPAPSSIARARVETIAALGVTTQRARALVAIARAFADQDPRGPDVLAALEDIPGVGPWTLALVAMRAAHVPDAFPAGDLGVQRALGVRTAAAAARRAERWRPWRAYAVMHLWQRAHERRST